MVKVILVQGYDFKGFYFFPLLAGRQGNLLAF